MLEELLQLDKDAFLFLNSLGSPTWDGFWMFVTNKLSSIPIYFILLVLVYRQWGLRKTLVVLATVAILILVTDQLANFFKYGVQRLRPCYDPQVSGLMRLVKSSCGGKFGYFSAHAANSFAIVLFFTILLRKSFKYIGFLLFLWAIIVAYSRIYIGVHFPLDIITGALIGMGMGWIFAMLYIFTLHKFQL
ncbi:phosphatase PAP2 family protein [Maribacter arenosus]|uniref:Phosphatase PAP2 family protein n=1 Tax=Maribacter arenosus TaxID=1854708 RepID=A0ABR7VBI1_9FLAO|nr:phosphatase PAP2 family protein [Maribacter arenosus]MBD0851033.1 phosphatase PAP2 family protein [Maribacter arenosus]